MELPPTVTERLSGSLQVPVRKGFGGNINLPRAASADSLTFVGGDPLASLPVLGAVRQFIDNERRRTRRLLVSLILLFAVLMVLFLVAGAFVVSRLLGDVKADVAEDRIRIEAAASRVDGVQKGLADETSKLKSELLDGTRKANTALSAVERVDLKMTNTLTELSTLKKNLGANVAEMKMNTVTLNDLNTRWDTFSKRFEDLVKENAVLKLKLTGSTDGPVQPQVAGSSEGMFLDLAPSNNEWRINWRLPAPLF